jgi:hypothetical protein
LQKSELAPLVELLIVEHVKGLSPHKLLKRFNRALELVLTAAPALPHLRWLDYEATLELKGDGLAVAVWLKPKLQRNLWEARDPSPPDLEKALRQDVSLLVASIEAAQARLDGLVAKVRERSERWNAMQKIRDDIRLSLSREEEHLLAPLRRHGGTTIDYCPPGADEVRSVLPLYPGAEVQRPVPVRLRARIRNFNRGSASIFHLSELDGSEWVPVVRLKNGDIALTWRVNEICEELAPIFEAVRDGAYAEFTATLFEDAASGVPIRAELWDGASLRRADRIDIAKVRRSGATRRAIRAGPAVRLPR